MAKPPSQDLVGLVDMGSNGIRFSITDLSSPTTRIMPTVFEGRCGVSLYDAQYSRPGEKGPIPEPIIQEVLSALLNFKIVCQDFSVPPSNIRIIATEATRTAINSIDYRNRIETETGWKVEMLPKEEEGRIGALGIASSYFNVTGLAMDLGGGSVQLSWLSVDSGVAAVNSEKITSLPYGAAALKQLLAVASAQGQSSIDSLFQKLSQELKAAVSKLNIPSQSKVDLFLSGGGFRGWGHILMANSPINPYPIALINGFTVTAATFLPTTQITEDISTSTFRISSRRVEQVPAITFLIRALVSALPNISTVHFAQGGVREGLLFSTLPPQIQSQHPLVAATQPFAPASALELLELLTSGLFSLTKFRPLPSFLTDQNFLIAVVGLLYYHAPCPKDIRCSAALRSTTTGILASTHGLLHTDRALLALTLCARWKGDLPPGDSEFHGALEQLVGAESAWWAKFLGTLARGVGETFPAGVVSGLVTHGKKDTANHIAGTHERLEIKMAWLEGKINVQIIVRREAGVPDWCQDLEKLGKKKNWVEGFGFPIKVGVVER